MTDFAAKIHFRTINGSEAAENGFIGGYGWVLGRYSSWCSFEDAIRRHFMDLGYDYDKCEQLLEIDDIRDLNLGEQRELFNALDESPIQFRTLHLYRHQDA